MQLPVSLGIMVAAAKGRQQSAASLFLDLAKFHEHVGHDHLWEEGDKTSLPRRVPASWCASCEGWRSQVRHIPFLDLRDLLPGCSGANTAAKLMLATLLESVASRLLMYRPWNAVDDISGPVAGSPRTVQVLTVEAARLLVVARYLPLPKEVRESPSGSTARIGWCPKPCKSASLVGVQLPVSGPTHEEHEALVATVRRLAAALMWSRGTAVEPVMTAQDEFGERSPERIVKQTFDIAPPAGEQVIPQERLRAQTVEQRVDIPMPPIMASPLVLASGEPADSPEELRPQGRGLRELLDAGDDATSVLQRNTRVPPAPGTASVSHTSGSMVVKCGRLWSVTFACHRGGGMGGVGPPPVPRVRDLGGLLLELSAGEFLGTIRSSITRNFWHTHWVRMCNGFERQPMPVPTPPWDKEDIIVCTRFFVTFTTIVARTHHSPHQDLGLLCLILTTIWYHHEE